MSDGLMIGIANQFRDAMQAVASPQYTPENITELRPDECFVFGSNRDGHHAGGAARVAVEKFGAIWGVGVGPQGQSYAIPTMGSFHEMEAAIVDFLKYAKAHPSTTFYVTRIGCGIARWSAEEVAPLFMGRTRNVIIPADFAAVIQGETK